MKWHLGCGPVHRHGWVNVDISRSAAADLVADAVFLPVREATLSGLEAAHLIEHLGYNGAVFALAQWYLALAPGGRLTLETPDPAGSFRDFLQAADRDERARHLGWIFGEESPGLNHPVLFPPDMLAELLAQAGFTHIRSEPPRTYPDQSGARWTCKRGDSALSLALARFKAGAVRSGAFRPDRQSDVVEFENQFVRAAVASAAAPGRFDLAASELIALSPVLASMWFSQACRAGALEPKRCEPWRTAANRCREAALPRRLYAAFLAHAEAPAEEKDGFEAEYSRACAFVGDHVATARPFDDLDEVFPFRNALPDGFERPFFSKIRALEYVEALRNKALVLFSRGDLVPADSHLESAYRLGVDPLYTPWNRAVLSGRLGRLADATAAYQVALSHAPAGVLPALAREAVICQAHAGKTADAAALLAAHPDVPGAETLKTLLWHRLDLPGGASAEKRAELPPLRHDPVRVGEGWYADPTP